MNSNNKIGKFEDLNVWQEAMELTEAVYKAFNQCNNFSFRDQIRRASVSIPANIAEGFDRQTNKEFIQFLFIAKGSAAEARTLLMLAKRLGYIDENNYNTLIESTRKISAMLFKFIETRKTKFN